MTADRTDRLFAITLESEHVTADRAAPGAFEPPETADAAFVPQHGRLRRWAGDRLLEAPGVSARALAAGGTLLGASFPSSSSECDGARECAVPLLLDHAGGSSFGRLARGGLSALTLCFAMIDATAHGLGRWREAVMSAAVVVAAVIVCVFALFARRGATYEIRPDSTPDAAPLPQMTQPDGSAMAQLRARTSPRSARH